MQNLLDSILQEFLTKNFGTEAITEKVTAVVQHENNVSTITVSMPFYLGSFANVLKQQLITVFKEHYPDDNTVVNIETKIIAHKNKNLVRGLENVKNIIAISSGKGGVGKSTVTANMALALCKMGARVGILDADIHGPSQPIIFGVKLDDVNKKSLAPVATHGIYLSSIGFYLTKDDPIVWRGPMVSRAFEQMIHDVSWPELDYLLLDMPPGTGDIAITLVKKIPVTAAIIVTTPQKLACADALKSLQMFKKSNVDVLGVIENMSGYSCQHCGCNNSIFGEDGGNMLAQSNDIPLLGKIPLHSKIRANADQGNSVSGDDSSYSQYYADVAVKFSAELSCRTADIMRQFSDD